MLTLGQVSFLVTRRKLGRIYLIPQKLIFQLNTWEGDWAGTRLQIPRRLRFTQRSVSCIHSIRKICRKAHILIVATSQFSTFDLSEPDHYSFSYLWGTNIGGPQETIRTFQSRSGSGVAGMGVFSRYALDFLIC